jgi:2-polyprenyl-6-methoxyphenol hydroxylase-like FAD-dependent oxidoreductase
MGLHWGAPVLRSLIGDEKWAAIQTVQVDSNTPTKQTDGLKFLNAATGDLINEPMIDNFYRLKRSALRAFLADRLDLRFGKKLVTISFPTPSTATAHFADGSSATGSMVIGADGPRSRVRELLLPARDRSTPSRLPFATSFVQSTYPREQALFLRSFHPLYLAGVHPHSRFAFFGIHDAADASRPDTWVFFFYISYPVPVADQDVQAAWEPARRLAHARGLARDMCEPWRSAYAWLPADDHPTWYSPFSQWDPSAEGHVWDNMGGRVTLAGDAAHVMTFQRGQGLNHSITDAKQLLDAIVKSRVQGGGGGGGGGDGGAVSADRAVTEYDEAMRARTGEEVRLCTMNTAMIHDFEKFLQSPVAKKGLKKE